MSIPRWCSPCGRRWYLVETKRHHERSAQRYLGSKGVGSYLPLACRWPKPAVGNEVGAMFPGYLFVHLDLAEEHSAVVWGLGVKRFVAFGESAPAEVPQAMIEHLKDREDDDGLIRLDDDEPIGKQVRMARGPLKDFCGVVKARLTGRERVIVLLEFLRQQIRVEAPSEWIERI